MTPEQIIEEQIQAGLIPYTLSKIEEVYNTLDDLCYRNVTDDELLAFLNAPDVTKIIASIYHHLKVDLNDRIFKGKVHLFPYLMVRDLTKSALYLIQERAVDLELTSSFYMSGVLNYLYNNLPPLMLAIMLRCYEIAPALVIAGADITKQVPNRRGLFSFIKDNTKMAKLVIEAAHKAGKLSTFLGSTFTIDPNDSPFYNVCFDGMIDSAEILFQHQEAMNINPYHLYNSLRVGQLNSAHSISMRFLALRQKLIDAGISFPHPPLTKMDSKDLIKKHKEGLRDKATALTIIQKKIESSMDSAEFIKPILARISLFVPPTDKGNDSISTIVIDRLVYPLPSEKWVGPDIKNTLIKIFLGIIQLCDPSMPTKVLLTGHPIFKVDKLGCPEMNL